MDKSDIAGWEEYTPWPWQTISFSDGTKERGARPAVMRRKLSCCNWEYRRMTDDETTQWMSSDAW